MRRGRLLVVTAAFLVPACASPPPPRAPPPAVATELDVPRFLLDFGAGRIPFLRRPEASVDELKQVVRETRGSERIEAIRELVVAHLWASEEAGDEDEAIRHRRAAVRAARVRTRNASLRAELAFVDLWSAWRAGRASAGEVAARYVEQQRETGELGILAWIIRGEIAADREEWESAAEAYRFLLGELEHPLYAFALFRTARCYRETGREAEARQALREVETLGRRRGASDATKKVAALARAQLRGRPRAGAGAPSGTQADPQSPP